MKSNGTKFLFLSLLITISTILISGCNDPEMDSRWRDRDITIDGNDAEWGNYIQYYDEKTRVVFCMFNDNSDMYIKLSSPNRIIQSRFISLGLTVWFDPEGGKDKKFGIHFPVGMQDGGLQMMRSERRTASKDDSEQITKMLEESQNEIELIGPGKNERCILPVTDAVIAGISVKMGKPKGSIIYELKVPLAFNEDHPYAIGTDRKKPIGIGFETGKLDKDEMRKMMPERRSQTRGMGERRDGMGGRRGRGMMPGGSLMPEPLELWTKVTLASEPVTQ